MGEHPVLLLKPIFLDDAPSKGLRAAFSLPPDRDDYIDYFCNVCLDRLMKSAAMLGLSVTDQMFHERLGMAILRRNPQLLKKNFGEWSQIVLEALLTTIRPPGSTKAGRPRDSQELFAQTYADIEFLKREKKLSIRNLSSRLGKMKGYRQRYAHCSADAIRKKYQQAVKLKDRDWQFNVFLSGPKVLMADTKIDAVSEAIDRHALKV